MLKASLIYPVIMFANTLLSFLVAALFSSAVFVNFTSVMLSCAILPYSIMFGLSQRHIISISRYKKAKSLKDLIDFLKYVTSILALFTPFAFLFSLDNPNKFSYLFFTIMILGATYRQALEDHLFSYQDFKKFYGLIVTEFAIRLILIFYLYMKSMAFDFTFVFFVSQFSAFFIWILMLNIKILLRILFLPVKIRSLLLVIKNNISLFILQFVQMLVARVFIIFTIKGFDPLTASQIILSLNIMEIPAKTLTIVNRSFLQFTSSRRLYFQQVLMVGLSVLLLASFVIFTSLNFLEFSSYFKVDAFFEKMSIEYIQLLIPLSAILFLSSSVSNALLSLGRENMLNFSALLNLFGLYLVLNFVPLSAMGYLVSYQLLMFFYVVLIYVLSKYRSFSL